MLRAAVGVALASLLLAAPALAQDSTPRPPAEVIHAAVPRPSATVVLPRSRLRHARTERRPSFVREVRRSVRRPSF